MVYCGKVVLPKGQKWLYSGNKSCIRAKWLYSVVVFWQERLYSDQLVVFKQKWLYSGKIVFVPKWLYLGKGGIIREKVVVFG